MSIGNEGCSSPAVGTSRYRYQTKSAHSINRGTIGSDQAPSFTHGSFLSSCVSLSSPVPSQRCCVSLLHRIGSTATNCPSPKPNIICRRRSLLPQRILGAYRAPSVISSAPSTLLHRAPLGISSSPSSAPHGRVISNFPQLRRLPVARIVAPTTTSATSAVAMKSCNEGSIALEVQTENEPTSLLRAAPT